MPPHKTAVVLRAAEVARAELPLVQRLDPESRFSASLLARLAGLQRTGVSRGRIPPGGTSYTYHAHLAEEEWLYILDGRARARIDDREYELAAGDFAAFPAPQAAHVLTNPYDRDCLYLFGGERRAAPEICSYPDLGKTFALVREPTRVAFHELGPATFPFGRADQPATDGAARWRVLGCRGCGSTIAEAALVLADIPYDRDEVDYTQPGPARDRLVALNPLAQVPTMILPDGGVMTETLAIVLHVDELVPAAGLLPPIGDPLRREALRWLAFVVAAIYPTFTYGDDPKKWIGDAGPALREATDQHRARLWQQMEAAAVGPWFLGARFSALDLYIAVMTQWRPQRPWFATNTPKLAQIARELDGDPRLRALWAASFD
ncbi:MAG TPA: cupin domain-containing protein [Kofleriaceae bacterium]|nr:cupin domain-containing protein [Kofleriaceae bacterium]